MSLPPFCDVCGGNRGLRPVDQTCLKCANDKLRKCRKEHIRKDEFDASNPEHFKLQTRGGAWRYYRKVGA